MFIAILILIVLSWFFIGFRAYACFSMLVIGLGAIIAVLLGADPFFMAMAVPMVIGAAVILLITSLRVEKSERIHYIIHLLLYGMFGFLRMMMIMLIVTIPLAALVGGVAADCRDMVLVDCFGNDTGRRVTVNMDTMKDAEGRSYTHHDPYD